MTIRDALLLLVAHTSRGVEAAKLIRQLDAGTQTAQRRALSLIRVAVDENSALTETQRCELRSLIAQPDAGEARTETLRFRCTPSEKAAIQLLATKYADGNMSRLILQALQEKYPTL